MTSYYRMSNPAYDPYHWNFLNKCQLNPAHGLGCWPYRNVNLWLSADVQHKKLSKIQFTATQAQASQEGSFLALHPQTAEPCSPENKSIGLLHSLVKWEEDLSVNQEGKLRSWIVELDKLWLKVVFGEGSAHLSVDEMISFQLKYNSIICILTSIYFFFEWNWSSKDCPDDEDAKSNTDQPAYHQDEEQRGQEQLICLEVHLLQVQVWPQKFQLSSGGGYMSNPADNPVTTVT